MGSSRAWEQHRPRIRLTIHQRTREVFAAAINAVQTLHLTTPTQEG
jgi:hypothetical protein